jgi:hypothetical protein
MICNAAHLLLLHELRVWAIVDHIATENRCREIAVDLLGVHILELAIENELVACCAEIYGRLLPKENEGEDVAILLRISWMRLIATVQEYQPFLYTGRRKCRGPCHR